MPGVMQVILFQQDEPAKKPEGTRVQQESKILLGIARTENELVGMVLIRVNVLLSLFHLGRVVFLHEIPEQTQTNIIAFAIYNLILIEKLSDGWAGQPSVIRLDITREMKRKGCKV